jgi:CP family cyanate transporter-like MFS transporter
LKKLTIPAILVIAFVLRPVVAQIGPILGLLQTGLSITDTELALLTAIPVLCFGFGAFAAPWLVRRLGIEQSMVYLLAIQLLAVVVRPYLGFWGFVVGTTIAGLSIAVANVLLPSIVRERFENNVVFMTSAYTTVLAASASFAAAISFPAAATMGWQFSLAIWGLPSLLAVLLSIALLKTKVQVATEVDHRDHSAQWKSVLKSPITWWVTALFGLQSLGFYALLGWLPSMGISAGLDPASAGGLLGLMTIIGVPVRFMLASHIGKFMKPATEGVLISTITLIGIALLLGQFWLPAVILISIGQAASFPLSLSLISTRASNMELTTILSSVAQGVGYLVAAVGTFLVGLLGAASGDWSWSIWLLVLITLVQAFSAYFAGLPRKIA